MKLVNAVNFATLTQRLLAVPRHLLQSVIPPAIKWNNVYKHGASYQPVSPGERKPISAPSVTQLSPDV